MHQNIQIRNKINEVNHDYDVLRRRAVLRRADRLRKADKLKRKHEADIQRTLGVDSYMARERAKNKQDTIEAFVMATVMFAFIYACLFWVVV